MIILSSAFAIVFFLVGVSLIYKGIANSSDAESAVDHQEYEQVRSRFDVLQQEDQELKLRLDAMAVELEEAKARASEAEKFKKDADSFRQCDQQYRKKIIQLEECLHFLSREADQQAKKAIDVIQHLNSENKSFQAQAHKQLENFSAGDIDALKDEKASLERQLNENITRIAGLEDELKNTREKSELELRQAQAAIEDMERHNRAFQSGMTEITDKISSVEYEFERARREKEIQLQHARNLVDSLRREKESLIQQGGNADEISDLESEIDRIKAESEGRLSEAHQNAGRLEKEVKRLQMQIQENQGQVRELQGQIETDRRVISGAAGEDKEELERELTELRETNQFLRQKERLLSQELLRSQTQALGLEKICKEFKKQIERR